LPRRIEAGFGHVQQLILIGKERGYLLYDEINDSLPADVHSSQEIDDLLSTLEREGIEIHENLAIANATHAAANAADGPEADLKEELAAEAGLDLRFGVDPQSQDPVRMYLREMGSVPLLAEVVIAKRIERGQLVVMKAITRAVSDRARTIRVPVHMIEVINKLARCSRRLVQELGREPTSEELAQRMDMTIEKVRTTRKIAQTPISFETPIGEEEDAHPGDFIEDKAMVSRSDAAISLSLKETMASMLNKCSPREERIIRMRFGFEDGNQRTLEEVGQVFAVTRERIRQIEAKALRKLRHPSRSSRVRVSRKFLMRQFRLSKFCTHQVRYPVTEIA
jgi:RNA polymerase sigma factor (sigma-70 family)